MLRFYTNRELAKRLDIPTAKWKRWSREFLPPDPLGGLQSGYARRYSVDDALTVFIGGVLVSDLRFGIPEARTILSDLEPWLREGGIFTGGSATKSAGVFPGLRAIELGVEIQRLPVGSGRMPAFQYRIRAVSDRSALQNGVRQEKYVEFQVPEGPPARERFRGSLLRVTDALRHFVHALELDRRYFGALR